MGVGSESGSDKDLETSAIETRISGGVEQRSNSCPSYVSSDSNYDVEAYFKDRVAGVQ